VEIEVVHPPRTITSPSLALRRPQRLPDQNLADAKQARVGQLHSGGRF
jgi:hypothetical protein